MKAPGGEKTNYSTWEPCERTPQVKRESSSEQALERPAWRTKVTKENRFCFLYTAPLAYKTSRGPFPSPSALGSWALLICTVKPSNHTNSKLFLVIKREKKLFTEYTSLAWKKNYLWCSEVIYFKTEKVGRAEIF